mgnify:CR=1 FL=1
MKTKTKHERTLAMLKPDGVKAGLLEECEKRILAEGLQINNKKTFRMSKELAEEFRKEIKEKQHYEKYLPKKKKLKSKGKK